MTPSSLNSERADWQEAIDFAENYTGDAQLPPGTEGTVILRSGETVYYVGLGAGLLEPRRGQSISLRRSETQPTNYFGVSARLWRGFWIHGGSPTGPRVTESVSISLPPSDELKVVDTGNFVVTSKRIVFTGAMLAREWQFAKLLSVQHDSQAPRTLLAVSNRQTVSVLVYDIERTDPIRFRMTLALARFQGRAEQLAAYCREQLAMLGEETSTKP